jgi:uncharacterized damage-inducible protein DinB
MSEAALFLIGELPGFTPHVGRLVSMMNYVRSTTIAAVTGLGVDELDYLHDSQSNSIGALLLHIAAAEAGYQVGTFEERGFSDDENNEWGTAVELGERSRREIRGRDLHYYLSRLGQVRAKTLAELARRDDQWLDHVTTMGSGQRINNYFKWFHVLSHEVNHRGQIRWLRTRATNRP